MIWIARLLLVCAGPFLLLIAFANQMHTTGDPNPEQSRWCAIGCLGCFILLVLSFFFNPFS
jgi:hypothetical protein